MAISPRVLTNAAEARFIRVESGGDVSFPVDAAVIWQTTTDADGLEVRQADTGKLWGFVGLLDASLASATGNYGLCQVGGYRGSSVFFQTNSNYAAGEPFVPVVAKQYIDSIATTTATNTVVSQQPIYGVLLASIASSSASATISRKVFIRA